MPLSRVDKLDGYQNPILRTDLSDLNLISLFEEMVTRLPDEAALVDGDTVLTYAELNQRANQIGRALLEISPFPGETVAALANMSPQMALMILGVFKARKVLIGLSPAQPVRRLEELTRDAEAKIMVCCNETRTLAGQLAEDLDMILLNIDEIGDFDGGNLGLPYQPEDTVSIIYTSGSTGKPKGAIDNHLVTLHGLGVHAATGLDASIRFLSIYHFSYANGLVGPFKSWLLGGTYHPFDLNKHGLAAMIAKLKQEQITVYQSPPSLFRNVVKQIEPGELSSIRWVHLGGEPVLARDFELFKEKFKPPCVFFNNYGSTEIGSMARNVMDHHTILKDEIVPLGHKTDRITLTLEDENGNPVQQGQVGEVVARSKYMISGFWKDPDLTAKRIQSIEGSDEKIIRTGDLVYQMPDGRYMYAGRKDSMVKVRGNRVYTTEIEAALFRIEGVEEAVIRVESTPVGDSRLIAYIQPEESAALTADSIRQSLANRLPAYMIPGQIIFVSEFPRTNSGKIDRQGLPDPDRSRPVLSHSAVSAASQTEERLLSIWQRVLDLKDIGVTDNFFNLGGDSLMAVELFVEIEKAFNQNLPVSLLLEAGTIRQQAAILETTVERDPWQPLVIFNQAGSHPPLFCFAGKGGNPIRFRQLASGLGTDQPVYFLQSRGLSGREAPLKSVQAIAADFIQAIQKAAPDGPYRLLGSSFGGKVAYEVACQLLRAGHQVEFVMMLDTYAPGYPQYEQQRSRVVMKWEEVLAYFSKHWHSLKNGSAEDRRAYLKYYFDLIPIYFKKRISKIKQQRESKRREGSLPAAYNQVEQANLAASRQFTPAPFPGVVILVRASQQPSGIVEDLSLGWNKYKIGELNIHQVDGQHGSLLMPPYVNQVAEILVQALGQ